MIGLLAFVVVFLVLSRAAGLLTPRLIDRAGTLAPWQRSWTLLFAAALPFILAGLIALVVFVPALAALVIGLHCHRGVCGEHAPVAIMAFPVTVALVAVVLVPFAAIALSSTAAAWRAAQVGTMLARLARPDGRRAFRVIDGREPFACCVGLLRREVVLSSALLADADATELAVVTLHEHAHACRFDNLRTLVAALLTVLWPLGARRSLLAELRLAAEQACDQAVSETLGARRVADTIRRLHERRRVSGGEPARETGQGRQGAAASDDPGRAGSADGVDGQAAPGRRAAPPVQAPPTLDPVTSARLRALEQPRWRGVPAAGLALGALIAGLQVVLVAQLLHHGLEAVLR